MANLLQTWKECPVVGKELSLYLKANKVEISDFLQFKKVWQIGYLIDFLASRYSVALFTKGTVYVVFVRIGELDRIVVDEQVTSANIIDTYMDAACAAIKYLEKPF